MRQLTTENSWSGLENVDISILPRHHRKTTVNPQGLRSCDLHQLQLQVNLVSDTDLFIMGLAL